LLVSGQWAVFVDWIRQWLVNDTTLPV
ncbi:MAG TPA: cytochrome C biogenesis protein ResC, partial [Corynebacterium variabile]|nr:cytochrome C biogenesis protein ResC [Corynebacterium variabile]